MPVVFSFYYFSVKSVPVFRSSHVVTAAVSDKLTPAVYAAQYSAHV